MEPQKTTHGHETSALSTAENKSTKSQQSKKKRDLKILQQVFPKMSESDVWSAYKVSAYGLDQAVKFLCVSSGQNEEDMIKKMNAIRSQHKQSKPKKEEEQVPEKKQRLNTSEEVYNKIKWCTDYDPDDFVIGYEDRFVGIQETKMTNFDRDITSESFIPWHRVMYFKQNDVIMWDRRSRLDKIFDK